jgi:hypothetical protein
MIKTALLLLIVGLALGACGGSDDDATPLSVPPGPPVEVPLEPSTPPPDPTAPSPDGPPVDVLDPPAPGSPLPDPADVVLSIVSAGGFVPIERALGRLPTVVVYADGTIIRPGPVPEIYPGALLPVLEAGRLGPQALEWLAEAARDSRVFDEAPGFGFPNVADLDSTTVTVQIDGKSLSANAYALYEEFSGHPALTAEQRDARQALMDFASDVFALAGTVGEWTEPALDRLVVWALPYSQPDNIDPGPAIEWPLDAALIVYDPDVGRACLELAGREAALLTDVAAPATQLTPWQVADERYALVVRPQLVPDDGCPA